MITVTLTKSGMEDYATLTTNLTLQFSVTETQFLGDNRESFEQERLILTRTLLCLLDQNETQLAAKQEEALFFNVIKALSHPNEQVVALALQCISCLYTVPSSFFATRSITSVFEKIKCLKPISLRLLAKIAKSASIGDIQRLVKEALADKDERLETAAILAAYKCGIQITVEPEKVIGPGAFICCQKCDVEKEIKKVAQLNVYAELAILQQISQIEDERKRLNAILQFVPQDSSKIEQSGYFVYLEILKQLNKLPFSVLKSNLHAVLETFIIILQNARSETQKISVLNQTVQIYQQCPKEGDLFSQLSDSLKRVSAGSENAYIQALALTALIATSPDQASAQKLTQISASVTGEIKQRALAALEHLSLEPEYQAVSMEVAQQLMRLDEGCRRSGFNSLLNIINAQASSAGAAAEVLLGEIEGCTDAVVCREACECLKTANCDQLQLISVLLQKSLLGSDDVKGAAFNALRDVEKQAETEKLQRCAHLAVQHSENDEFEADTFVFEEDGEDFNPEDFLLQKDLILEEEYDTVKFGISRTQQKQSSKTDEEVRKYIEAGYKSYFTRGEYEPAGSQTLDFSVSVCKVFIERESSKELQLIYQVVPDEGMKMDDVQIKIGKMKSTRLDATHFVIIAQYSQLDEIRELSNVKLRYSGEDDDETIKLFDVGISTYDLIQPREVDDYQKIYEEKQAETEEIVIHLSDIPDVETAIENIPSFCGLLNVEIVDETYKKAVFFMTGQLLGVGDIVCKVSVKQSKVGVKAKIHCVGPATDDLYKIFV